jgi:hypothetical protein
VDTCPECGGEILSPDEGCIHCGKKDTTVGAKRRAQADLLLKIGAIIFIFGLFLPILFVSGAIIFAAGAVVYLMYRK